MGTRSQTPDELKNLSLSELIKYSIRSKECMENVKSMTTRPMKFNIEVGYSDFTLTLFHGEQPERNSNLSEDVAISAESKKYRIRGEAKEININGQTVLASFKHRNHFYTYWNSPIDGICFFLDYFSNIFNSPPIYKLEFSYPSTQADREEITSWIKNKRASIVEHLNVTQLADNITTIELMDILGKVKPTAALDISVKTDPGFRYELPSDFKTFSCSSSNWLTKEDVMKMNYEFIDIDVEKLSYQDLSDFATKCIEGGFPALQHCFIEAKDLKRNFKKIADGIKFDRTWSRLEVKVWRRKYTYFSYDVYGIYDYERTDGKTVTICASKGEDKHCVLHLYVWTK